MRSCLLSMSQACPRVGPAQDLTEHLSHLDLESLGSQPSWASCPPTWVNLQHSLPRLSVLAPWPSLLVTIRPSQSLLQREEQVSEGPGLQPKQMTASHPLD